MTEDRILADDFDIGTHSELMTEFLGVDWIIPTVGYVLLVV